jgi:hypothetical protein
MGRGHEDRPVTLWRVVEEGDQLLGPAPGPLTRRSRLDRQQLGHTGPALTFRVHQKAAKRRDRLGGRYREAFDAALDWAALGRIEAPAPARQRHPADEQANNPLAQAENRYPGR